MSDNTRDEVAAGVWNVLNQIIVDHPMWIGDDGEPLDYLPERESRIHDFIAEVTAGIARLLDKARTEALRDAADEREAQMVCCDVYDRLKDKPTVHWTVDECREAQRHAICYWGAACAEADRAHADAITREAALRAIVPDDGYTSEDF